MSSVLFTGIGQLVTNDPALGPGPLGVIDGAALLIEDGRVAWAGPAAAAPEAAGAIAVDTGGRAVIPGFVDSHTHAVFAGERSAEFAARMSGRPYTAGGIATTVAATRQASDEELAASAGRVVAEAAASGTTTIECKSGYGLRTADEERLLRVARRFTAETTFLGAHVVPPEYAGRADDYVALVCAGMLEACAPHARWIDVFCDRGAFDGDQAAEILRAGARRGLVGRVHAGQLATGPGVRVAAEAGAASADHCTHLTAADVDLLAAGTPVATLLPGCDFSTRSRYPDGRRLLDAGATVALATDCNPGSSFTTSMPLCIALAVREMGFTPAEAVQAATLGGAKALRRDDVGRLTPGARGDVVVLDAPSHVFLAYRPGVALVHSVWRSGTRIWPDAVSGPPGGGAR